jgi:hypothetical protein
MDMKGLEQFAKTRMSGLIGHLGGFRAMLRKFMLVERGIDNAWSFQLVYSLWKQRGLSIIPNVNLVSNIGNVADSAHPWRKDISHLRGVCGMPDIVHPDAIQRDKEADDFHSGMLATEYGGREDFLLQEVKRRFARGDGRAARELLALCQTFYGADHPGFQALGCRISPLPSGNE